MGQGARKASGAAGQVPGLHLGGHEKDVCLTHSPEPSFVSCGIFFLFMFYFTMKGLK